MLGITTWVETCPMCDGKSKIQVWDKKGKTILPSCDCPTCEGKGKILIRKHLLRKKV
jgi:hypothetical protein